MNIMKKFLLFLLVVGGVLAVLLTASHFLKREDAAVTQHIGVLLPLTGDASSYGQKGRKAIEMAVDDFNATEGATGKKVTAIFEDSKGNAKDGVSAAQKLISVDKVPAIVGDALSAVTLPVAAVAEANQIVLISPCSSAPALTQAGKFIYRIWPSDLAEGNAAAGFAVSKGFKKAAILHLNNDYGNGIADIFMKRFASDDRKVVLKSAYADTTTDWRTIVAAVPGALYAHYVSFIDPTSFTIHESIFILSIIIIGGMGNLWGSLAAAAFMILVPEALRFVGMPSGIAANMRQVLYGTALVLVIIMQHSKAKKAMAVSTGKFNA